MKWSEVKAGMLIDQVGLVIDPDVDVSEGDERFLAEQGKGWARIFDWNDCSYGCCYTSIDISKEYALAPSDVTEQILIDMKRDMKKCIEDIKADLEDFGKLTMDH